MNVERFHHQADIIGLYADDVLCPLDQVGKLLTGAGQCLDELALSAVQPRALQQLRQTVQVAHRRAQVVGDFRGHCLANGDLQPVVTQQLRLRDPLCFEGLQAAHHANGQEACFDRSNEHDTHFAERLLREKPPDIERGQAN